MDLMRVKVTLCDNWSDHTPDGQPLTQRLAEQLALSDPKIMIRCLNGHVKRDRTWVWAKIA